MERYPLLKLPYLALKQVVVRLDFIKFALCSAKCYRIVKTIKLNARQLRVNYRQNHQGLQLEFKWFFLYDWNFDGWNSEEMDDYEDEEEEEYKLVNKTTFPSQITPDPNGNNIASMEYLIDFVKDLFEISYITYVLKSDGFANFQKYLSDRFVNREGVCDQILISSYCNPDFLMKTEDFHFVLDNIPKGIEIKLTGDFPNDFKYEKPLTQKKISTDTDEWMTTEHILNSNFQHLKVLFNCKFSLEDYNLFMKKWLNHELHEDFRYVFMSINYRYETDWNENDEHMKTILDGLDVKEYDHTRNLENYPFEPIFREHEKLFDIHRDDGMIASISLSDRFIFRVWIPEMVRSPY